MALNLFKKKEKLPLPTIPLRKQERFLKKNQVENYPTEHNETIEKGARFIYLEDHEQIMQNTQNIRQKLTQAEDTIKNIEKLKTLHEQEIKKLLKTLEQTERKITQAEEIISKAETI